MRPAPIKAVTPALLRRCPLPLETCSGKEGRGVVVVAGGAPQMPGAIVLTATAALRAGAGKLRIVTPAGIAGLVGIAVPEAYVIGVEETRRGGFARLGAVTIVAGTEHADAIVIGPGMVDEAGSAPAIAGALEKLDLPAVIDASALAVLKYRPDILRTRGAPAVITPHCGEMAQLLGRDRDEIEHDMPQSALDAATRFGAVVALKARDTHIATPDGERFRFRGGTVRSRYVRFGRRFGGRYRRIARARLQTASRGAVGGIRPCGSGHKTCAAHRRWVSRTRTPGRNSGVAANRHITGVKAGMDLINPTRLDSIPTFPENAKDHSVVHAIIETPRDIRHKYAFEPKYGTFVIKQVLPDGLTWPYDYGFIPQTLADDGDPLDILNLTEIATFTGCLVECRILGIVRIKKDGVRNDRLLAAPLPHKGVAQPTDDWNDADDIPAETIDSIIRFLIEYSAEQGHDVVCKGLKSRKVALEAVHDAVDARLKRQRAGK